MHTPKNWDATRRETAGGSAYPLALRGGTTNIASTAGLYDPAERGTEGTLIVGLLDPSFETGTDLDSQPLLTGADWRTNGRFFGVVQIPEAVARAHETIAFTIAKGDKACSQNPLLRWSGQTWNSLNCPQPWSHDTRYPAGGMTPYLLAPAADMRVSSGAITVYADDDKLRLRIEPPVGETIKVTADLTCVTSGTGVCL